MDPNACLRRILENLGEDPDEAASAARDLLEWLEKGGFTPELQFFDTRIILQCFCFGVIAGVETTKSMSDGTDKGVSRYF